MVSLARLQQLDHQHATLGHSRPLLLQFEQRPHRAHFGFVVDAGGGACQHRQRGVGEFRRQRHAAARPLRHRSAR
jgi:hypothetical protein